MGKMTRFFRGIATAIVFCSVSLIAAGQYSTSLLSNKSGSSVSRYDVVTWSTANSNAFTTTTTSRDTKVIGVVTAASIANNAAGMITQPGAIVKVRVTGLVTRGDYVVTSTTAGAGASGGTTDISGAFGVALETGTSTNIYVYLLSPELFSSTSAISTGAITASGTFTGTVNDSATNTVITLASLFHTSTGTPASGLGSKIVLGAEDSAGNSETAVELHGYFTDVTNGAEQGAFLLRLMNAGTVTDTLKIAKSSSVLQADFGDTTTASMHRILNLRNNSANYTTLLMFSEGAAEKWRFGHTHSTDTLYALSATTGSAELTIATTGVTVRLDLAVNGGDLTSTASTFNLLASPTTVAIGAAATTLNLGAATGTATIANATVALSGATAFTIAAANSTFSGNMKLGTAGNGVYVKEGSNATMGTATLVLGTATVSTTKVTANSRIMLTVQSLGTVAVATPIAVTARSAGTSFTITSSNATDTSVVGWLIVEPAIVIPFMNFRRMRRLRKAMQEAQQNERKAA